MSNPNTHIQIQTQKGETLDCALYRLGRYDDRDTVIAANPHITQLPPVLPEFTLITLPVVPETISTTPIKTIQLWD